MPSLIEPRSKYVYLLGLRSKAESERTAGEQHELDQARISYGAEWWKSDRELSWEENARAVGEFHRTRGEWPGMKVADRAERRLGMWLSGARKSSKHGTRRWVPQRDAYLDQVAPGWRGEDRELVWRGVAYDVGAFHRANGRWPSKRADDPDERRLGVWLTNARTNSKNGTEGWTADRGAHLDRVAPGWRGEDREMVWRGFADEVAIFHHTHGRWPSTTAKGPEERRLGRWISDARTNSKNGRNGWTADRGAHLDRVAPGWRGEDREMVWRVVADEVAAFHRIHGRWPRMAAADPEERRLGQWLSRTRTNTKTDRGGWVSQRAAYLDDAATGWRCGDGELAWRAVADEVAAFQRIHGRWPITTADGPAERRLGRWLNDTRKYSKNSTRGWTADRGAYLDEVAPGWRGSPRG